MKKILALSMIAVLAIVAVVGGTLAYFTDNDAQKNTFTTGNVAIDLWEDFGDNDAEGIEHLVPAVGSAQDGTIENDVEKEIYVTNDGTEDAYVRVHIAIPAILDDVNNAGKNTLHFNMSDESIADGKWNWTRDTAVSFGDPEDDNRYTATIDGVEYNVYVVTYETALKQGETTYHAIHQVYLDPTVTNEDITDIKKVLDDRWHIYVVAEGAQAAGFVDAFDALNTAFGNPSDSNYTSDIDWDAVAEGKTWENKD